jgi:hypothetical protein
MFLLPKLTEAIKSKKNDSKFSPKTLTKQVQNLFRYIGKRLIYLTKDTLKFLKCDFPCQTHKLNGL